MSFFSPEARPLYCFRLLSRTLFSGPATGSTATATYGSLPDLSPGELFITFPASLVFLPPSLFSADLTSCDWSEWSFDLCYPRASFISKALSFASSLRCPLLFLSQYSTSRSALPRQVHVAVFLLSSERDESPGRPLFEVSLLPFLLLSSCSPVSLPRSPRPLALPVFDLKYPGFNFRGVRQRRALFPYFSSSSEAEPSQVFFFPYSVELLYALADAREERQFPRLRPQSFFVPPDLYGESSGSFPPRTPF